MHIIQRTMKTALTVNVLLGLHSLFYVCRLLPLTLSVLQSHVYLVSSFECSVARNPIRQQRHVRVSSHSFRGCLLALPKGFRIKSNNQSRCRRIIIYDISASKSASIDDDIVQDNTCLLKFQPNMVSTNRTTTSKQSVVIRLRSHNLAGFVGSDKIGENNDVVISLVDESNGNISGDNQNFVAVTGETASGKSMFVVRVLEILTGRISNLSSKLTSYVSLPPINDQNSTSLSFVEVEVYLVEPHLSAIESVLCKYFNLYPQERNLHGDGKIFKFRRTLQMLPVGTDQQKFRLKSTCTINERVLSLTNFTKVTRPLFAIVDATIAINMILPTNDKPGIGGSNLRRTIILDSAVPKQYIRDMDHAKYLYSVSRQNRIHYEREINRQQSSRAFKHWRANSLNESASIDDEQKIEVLSHFITELDNFEKRMIKFCRSIYTPSSNDNAYPSIPLDEIASKLSITAWDENSFNTGQDDLEVTTKTKSRSKSESISTSRMYVLLLEFRDALSILQDQCKTTKHILDTLNSLTCATSALAAVQASRDLLTDLNMDDETYQNSVERTHELLNNIEISIKKCVHFVEKDSIGLLPMLENVSSKYEHISIAFIDDLINEWKLLARKHNVSPYLLPNCHIEYKFERDGANNISSKLLPQAKEKEQKALQQYRNAYTLVTNERQKIAQYLSTEITQKYLSRLGFEEQITFIVDMKRNDPTTASPFLIDRTIFSISQTLTTETRTEELKIKPIALAASSGERARLLLAIECVLPGSIGLALSAEFDEATIEHATQICDETWHIFNSLPPITTIYDEIDAHIGGGFAIKAVGSLLNDQSKRNQIIAITHNPIIASSAQTHVILQKITADNIVHGTVHKKAAKTGAIKLKPKILVKTIFENEAFDEIRIIELIRMVCGSSKGYENFDVAREFVYSLIKENRNK